MSLSKLMLTAETMREHRARWFVYTGGGAYGGTRERIPWQSTMRGTWPGYDVVCSCGWESRTGGATRRSVEDELFDHRLGAQADAGASTGGCRSRSGCPPMTRSGFRQARRQDDPRSQRALSAGCPAARASGRGRRGAGRSPAPSSTLSAHPGREVSGNTIDLLRD